MFGRGDVVEIQAETVTVWDMEFRVWLANSETSSKTHVWGLVSRIIPQMLQGRLCMRHRLYMHRCVCVLVCVRVCLSSDSGYVLHHLLVCV